MFFCHKTKQNENEKKNKQNEKTKKRMKNKQKLHFSSSFQKRERSLLELVSSLLFLLLLLSGVVDLK